jgi:hypothetical protein
MALLGFAMDGRREGGWLAGGAQTSLRSCATAGEIAVGGSAVENFLFPSEMALANCHSLT